MGFSCDPDQASKAASKDLLQDPCQPLKWSIEAWASNQFNDLPVMAIMSSLAPATFKQQCRLYRQRQQHREEADSS